ncbi:MAG: hypothetical protein HYU68_13505 [Bacteroidetes bacterium]|nr:hypothetical protein [Bacteroidota bacterium]
MTPFIFWLNKEEIDELIAFIIRSDMSDKLKHEDLNGVEIQHLTEKLLLQNEKLVKLFRKIEPLNPIQKKAVQTYGVKQKCNHYQEQFVNMNNHCNIYGNQSIKNSNEHHDLACYDCPINTLK